MSWIAKSESGALLKVRVVPNASRNEVSGPMGDELKIRIQSPANEGKANKALVKFISKRLGVSKSKVEILKGAKARTKTIHVADATKCEVIEKLTN